MWLPLANCPGMDAEAAEHAWNSLVELAGGSKVEDVDRHRAVVILACQVKVLRDWLIVQVVEHADLSLQCVRTPLPIPSETDSETSLTANDQRINRECGVGDCGTRTGSEERSTTDSWKGRGAVVQSQPPLL